MLSNRQEEELKTAVLDYLYSHSFTLAYQALLHETHLDHEPSDDNVLERKWTTILRLQKKIATLQTKVDELEAECNTQSSGLPRHPGIIIPGRGSFTDASFHGKLLATSSEDGLVRLNHTNGDLLTTIKHDKPVYGVAFDLKGDYLLAACGDTTLKCYETREFKLIRTYYGHDHVVSGVVLSPASDWIASCSRDTTVRVWNTHTGHCLQVLRGHTAWVRAVAVSHDGSYIASCGDDHMIMLWSTSKWTCLSQLRGHEHVVESIDFASPSALQAISTFVGKPLSTRVGMDTVVVLASGSRDKSIRLWNAGTGECLFIYNGHENWVRGVAFFHSYLVSVSDDKTMVVWDVSKGSRLKAFEAHEHFVTFVKVHPQLSILCTGSVDQTAKIWHTS